LLVVATLLGVAGYISFLAPPTGDSWGYVTLAKGNTPVDLFWWYLNQYFVNNPRLGQYLLSLTGYGQIATGVIGAASLAMVLVAGCIVSTGRLFAPKEPSHVALLVMIFGILVASGAEVGRALFYAPYTTNYVFGFGLLLLFLGHVRLFKSSAKSWQLVLVGASGFLSGLTNEHTVPFFLGVGLFAIALDARKLVDLKLKAVHYVAFFSLFAGYIALYFAPGQNVRYGDSVQKLRGFEAFLTKAPSRASIIETLLLTNSIPYYLLSISLLAICTIIAWRRREIEKVIWPALMLSASIGMATTVIASPLIGQRLLFSSYAALAISVAGSMWYLRSFSIVYYATAIAAALAACNFLYQGTIVYRELDNAYIQHIQEIAEARASGNLSPVFDIYYQGFLKHPEYVRPEFFSSDPQNRVNRMRAKFFALDSISYRVP